jgi:hypothetical protein
MEFKTSSFNMQLKIEPDPNGGFVARASDNSFELRAATREELQAKIRDKFREMTGIGVDFPIPSGGAVGSESIRVEKKFTFTKSFGSTSGPNPLGPGQDALQLPTDAGSAGGAARLRRFLWIVGAAVLAGLLAYTSASSKGMENAAAVAVLAVVIVAGIGIVLARRS